MKWLRRVLFPVLLVGPIAFGWTLATMGLPHFAAVMVAASTTILPILLLQRLMPATVDWAGRPQDYGLDLLHAIFTSAACDLWRAFAFGVAFAASAWLTTALGASLWPTSWPLLAQAGLALLIGDFGQYWLHRGMHEWSWLWPIHAMHHSSERLYVLSATRTHPFNFIAVYAASMLPMIVLGAPLEVLFLVSTFTAVLGMLQHANIDFDHGPFNLIFATADLHRWHHSEEFVESNANYGSNLILWDTVFGTRYLPQDRKRPARVGLKGTTLPENWWVHLASPFTLSNYEGRADLVDFDAVEDFTLEAQHPRDQRDAPVWKEPSPPVNRV